MSDDYRTLYSLGTKGNTVDIREFIKMAIYAVCYVKLLQEAKFFTASGNHGIVYNANFVS